MKGRQHRGQMPLVLGPILTRFRRIADVTSSDPLQVIGRDAERAEIIEVLLRRRRNNAVIIGPPGSGKSVLARDIGRVLTYGANGIAVPSRLAGRVLVEIDLRAVLAGSATRGQLEERCLALFNELCAYGGRVIPLFEDLGGFSSRGSAGEVDLLWLLEPILDSREIAVLATASISGSGGGSGGGNGNEHQTRRFLSPFEPVELSELAAVDLRGVLEAHRPGLETHHGQPISAAAIDHAAYLGRRYVRRRSLPDSALSLLDQAAAASSIDAGSTAEVTPAHVAVVASRWTGIPLRQLLDEEAEQLTRLERILERRVVGQDAAVGSISRAVRRARVRLNDTDRPIGSFLFLGPTGVGKTELARALAELLFQDERSLIRIDMSEYMERHQIARLIGAPPGYVGYGDGGQLTDAVRQRPYSVVLLDELEKAHSDVFNLLLQVLEDGRLTDGHGRTVDFAHAVVILTSNCGSEHIVRLRDGSASEVADRVMDAVRTRFKPEFLNRLDEIIVFNSLTKEVLRQVVDIQIARVQERAAEHRIEIELSSEARDWLAANGYDSDYGARPLRRLIRREIEDALAREIVNGRLRDGGTVFVSVGGEHLELRC